MDHNESTSLDPLTALGTCERALRELVATLMKEKHGSDWVQVIATTEKLALWGSKRNEETTKRQKRGVAEVGASELAYSEFYDLVRILKRDWETFAPALGKKAETLALLGRMEDLRNSVAHNRPLVPFERDLLSGIAGEIRNKVAIFMTGTDPDGQHWPIIESITDGLGQDVTNGGAVPGPPLRPGHVVLLDCRGTDPQGRELEWQARLNPVGVVAKPSIGNEVTLSWVVHDRHIMARAELLVTVTARGAQYHAKAGGWDANVVLIYRMLPPIPAHGA